MFYPGTFISILKKKLAPVLALLLFCTGVFSQTLISGMVRDMKGHPVPGASITVKNSFDGATSDSLGKYSFNSTDTGLQTLTVRSVGFRQIEVTLHLTGKSIQLD